MSDILKRFLNKGKQNNSLFKPAPGAFGSQEEQAKFDQRMNQMRQDIQKFKNRNRYSQSFNKQVTANVKNIAGNTFFDSGEKRNSFLRSRFLTDDDKPYAYKDRETGQDILTPRGQQRYLGKVEYSFLTPDAEGYRLQEEVPGKPEYGAKPVSDKNPTGSFDVLDYDKIYSDLAANRNYDPKSGELLEKISSPADGYKGLEEQAKLSSQMSFGLSDALRRYSSTDPKQAQLLSNTPEGVRNALAQGKQTLRDIGSVRVKGNAVTQPFVQELSKDQLELYKEADKKARQYAADMQRFDNIGRAIQESKQELNNFMENARSGNFSTSPESPSTFQQLSKNIQDFKFATPLFKKKIKKYKK